VPKSSDTAILILAAGGSRRLGRPKQLVEIEAETLLRRTASRAIASNASRVGVVLGHDGETMRSHLDDLDLEIIVNPDWQRGMGTSIRHGVQALANREAILITVCDQPHLTTDIFDELIARLPDSRTGIVASRYAGTLGVPAIFGAQHFPALLTLPDDQGAKNVIAAHDVTAIDFPEGVVDIDTPNDFANL
jgi:molybdenum cofactor cytidylyltransferase